MSITGSFSYFIATGDFVVDDDDDDDVSYEEIEEEIGSIFS